MGQLKTFSAGGVHRPDKKLTRKKAIQDLLPPVQVTIPIRQHIGKAGTLLVERGADVLVGTPIAAADGFISAAVHSSVSGTVKKIDAIVDAQGFRRTAVVIAVSGDTWEEHIDTSNALIEDIPPDRSVILSKISAAGIVGAGGATFPTAVKFSIPEGRSVDTLIINGVECEPYLTADHRLMLEHADELIVGTRLLMHAAGVGRAIIGIEINKEDAIALLLERIREKTRDGKIPEGFISVVPLKERYPQGGEKQLIEATTGREVPSGRLPLDVHCIVSNVSTAFAVYQGVQKNRPFVDRIVTVTGEQLVASGGGANLRVRFGTPLREVIEAAGGVPESTGKIIMGGPMTGRAVTSLEVPVTKGTGGVILIDKNLARRSAVGPCIRCSSCVGVCPMGLEPYLLEKLVQRGRFEDAEREGILDCIECGSCSYVCPSNRAILDWIRLGKVKVGELRRERMRGTR